MDNFECTRLASTGIPGMSNHIAAVYVLTVVLLNFLRRNQVKGRKRRRSLADARSTRCSLAYALTTQFMDDREWCSRYRFSKSEFSRLMDLLRPKLATSQPGSVSPRKKLMMTLRYLASGKTRSLFFFRRHRPRGSCKFRSLLKAMTANCCVP